MKTITVRDRQVDIYNIYDFPYDRFYNCSTVENDSTSYFDIVCTFDIETTTILESEWNGVGGDFGFMYVWQFCCDGIVVMGRTWKEYLEFIRLLKRALQAKSNKRVIIYVHNLGFEFQFMRNFIKFTRVFATDNRQPIYAISDYCEYRCSWKLTNMGLNKFCEKTDGVHFKKLNGKDFDYSIKRYPDTELTDEEYGYCVCDVLGLWEGICIMLNKEKDTLATIPITNTGYVRRDYRNKCLSEPGYKRHMLNKKLSKTTYILNREASRGAIAGSNNVHTDITLTNIDSEDIKSSYPYQMETQYFPDSKFLNHSAVYGSETLRYAIDNYCCIIVWSCENLILNKDVAIPYISKAKCRAIQNPRVGNGKVYAAEKIGMCCTEIDFKIIHKQYKFNNARIHKIYCCERGMLAKSFREHLMDMFIQKTLLEHGDPYLYMKTKNKINSSFGMMLTDILHNEIKYFDGRTCWKEIEVTDIESALNKYYNSKNSFLNYQDGVWVLAHGRKSLVEGMDTVGMDLVQVDTDSVKHRNKYTKEFEKINDRIRRDAEKFDVKPYIDINGKRTYLGIWEHEGDNGKYTYDEFRTLGAKKYCYKQHGKLSCTVSGLSKDAGKWLENNGGIEAFKTGTIFPPSASGRTSSLYNDWGSIRTINIFGHSVTLGSNVAVRNIAYTLGMTTEWAELVLDGIADEYYNPMEDGAFKTWIDLEG